MTSEALATYHATILEELRSLKALARKVLDAHRAEAGKELHEVWDLVADLLEDLGLHLREEEEAAFAARSELRGDHVQVRLLLRELRQVTRTHPPPTGACAAWIELWQRLGDLDEALSAQMWREEEFAAS